jgi:hypothetical protein
VGLVVEVELVEWGFVHGRDGRLFPVPLRAWRADHHAKEMLNIL